VLPVAIFALTRLANAMMIAFLARDQMHPDADDLSRAIVATRPASTDYFTVITNWDGQWFREIVLHGYPQSLPRAEDGAITHNAWAFPPFFPALVRMVMFLWNLPFGAAATLVSLGCGAGAMVVLYRLVERTGGRVVAGLTVLALCVAPPAPAFQMAYTESLGLLLLVVCLHLLSSHRYLALSGVVVLLSLCRPLGVPLAAVILVHGFMRWRRKDQAPLPATELRRCIAAAVVAGLSAGIWPGVAAVVTGEPNAYMDTLASWVSAGGSRTSWLARLFDSDTVMSGVFAVVSLAALAWVVGNRRAKVWGGDLRAWALLYAVYLSIATYPTSSDIRHSLLTIVPWWPMPFGQGVRATKTTVVVVAAGMLAIGLPLQFMWLRYLVIVSPDTVGFP